MARRRRHRTLSKKAARNQTCHAAIQEIRAGNCSLPDMAWAVNEACRRAPRNLQAHLTRVLDQRCGGRLQGPRRR
jgi:hypothetical protein